MRNFAAILFAGVLALASPLALAQIAGPGGGGSGGPGGSNFTQTVVQGGSTGADFSVNKPTPPNVGSPFAASGPYASYVLIATVPASTRAGVDVENNSGAQIVIVLDDGTAASGAAPNNASVFALGGGGAPGSQGGSWISLVERGRVQVYAPSASAQVTVRTN